jgi:hypothetical protein
VDPSDLVYRGIGSRLLSRVDPERIDMMGQSYGGYSTIFSMPCRAIKNTAHR